MMMIGQKQTKDCLGVPTKQTGASEALIQVVIIMNDSLLSTGIHEPIKM
jgi:hypothetical protein